MRKYTIYFCMCILLFALLSACSQNTNKLPSPTPTKASVEQIHEYALPREKGGLMRPAIDSQGHIWSAAMGHNALILFDPQTQKFSEIEVPDGKYGIMGLLVTPNDTIWFAEQYANYIGHYDPKTQKFQTYPLPTLKTPDPSDEDKQLTLPSAPNELALDADGNLWFTKMNADAIGMLNSKTGELKHYKIGSQQTIQELTPYGITIDTQGTIWFTLASTNELGRLEPSTGEVQLIPVQNPGNPLMQIESDEQGTIWATTFRTPHLVAYNPTEETFASYTASEGDKPSGGLYDLAIARDGTIWTTSTAANQLAHFDTIEKRFSYYTIPTAASIPIGLAIAPDETVWFTESGGNKLGSLKIENASKKDTA